MKLKGFRSMFDMIHASKENLKNSFVKEYSNECEGNKPMKPKRKKSLSDSAKILRKLGKLNSKIEKGFNGVNKRIDRLEKRTLRLEKRTARIEERVVRLEKRTARIEGRLDYIVKANKLKDVKN